MSGIIINPYTYIAASSDPYWSYVVALLHMDGSNGSTVFTDQIGHTFSASGSSVISTSQSKFGGASLANALYSGVSAADSNDWNFGAGDFTIEFWVRSTDTSGIQGLVVQRSTTAQYSPFILFVHPAAGNVFKALFSTSDTDWDIQLASTTAMSTNTWYFVAVSRSGSTFRLFIDGVLEASATNSGTLIDSSTNLVLGGFASTGDGFNLAGYLDDFRMTKGIARYTANFTPPSAAFPDS